jgi:hypothetical protein
VAVEVRHVLDVQAITRLLSSPTGGVAKDMMRRGYRVEAAAKRCCPVDHGRLRSSIHTQMTHVGGRIVVEIGTDVEYALWVHNGTGLYGPRHARIYPKKGKVMVWTNYKKFRSGGVNYIQTKGGKDVVRSVTFARSTRGMRGTPFLRDALPAARR